MSRLQRTNKPVSYTHLDVYKRQAQAHERTLQIIGRREPVQKERIKGAAIEELRLSLIHI